MAKSCQLTRMAHGTLQVTVVVPSCLLILIHKDSFELWHGLSPIALSPHKGPYVLDGPPYGAVTSEGHWILWRLLPEECPGRPFVTLGPVAIGHTVS